MWRNLRVGVVVPAYREERLIAPTLRTIPSYVDAIFAVDDGSPDDTIGSVRSVSDPRIRLIRHGTNQGVGAAIVTGYRAALDAACDAVAVMAGDGQMDPSDLSSLLAPLATAEADYVKGNRFAHPLAHQMPAARRVAGRLLSAATRAATGLAVSDTQCGYTAIGASTVRRLPLDGLWPRFGYPNDLLAMLAECGARVAERPVRPVYRDEASGVRPWHVAAILFLLARRRRRRRCQDRTARSTISSAQRSA